MAKPNIKGEAIPANYWFPVVLNSDVKDSVGMVRYTAIQLPVANATATGTGYCNADGTSKHPDIAKFITVCGTLTAPSDPNVLTYAYLKNNFAGFTTSETFQTSDFTYDAGTTLATLLDAQQGTVTEYYTLSGPGGATYKISNSPRTKFPPFDSGDTEYNFSITPPTPPFLDDSLGTASVICRPWLICSTYRYFGVRVRYSFSGPIITIKALLRRTKTCTVDRKPDCCSQDDSLLKLTNADSFESMTWDGSDNAYSRQKEVKCPNSLDWMKRVSESYNCHPIRAEINHLSEVYTKKYTRLPAYVLPEDKDCCEEYSNLPGIEYSMVFSSRGNQFEQVIDFSPNAPFEGSTQPIELLTSGQKNIIIDISTDLQENFDRNSCPPIKGASGPTGLDASEMTTYLSNASGNTINQIFDSLEAAMFTPDFDCCT